MWTTEYINASCCGVEQKAKKKKKKEKKEKVSGSSSSGKKKHKKQSDYIEAEGITTPSKEQLPPNQAPTPAAYKLPVSANSHFLNLLTGQIQQWLYNKGYFPSVVFISS